VLDVEFVISEDPDFDGIEIYEDRGRVVYKIGRKLFETPELMASMLTETARAVIAGGRWFQLWKGDVIAAEPVPRRLGFPGQRPTGDVA
jgi:hypothetical protein